MTRRKKAYLEYLKSDHWASLRGLVLLRDGHKCTRCQSTVCLQAHHTFYRKNFTDSQTEDLITLCRTCHELEHTTNPKPRRKKRFKANGGIRHFAHDLVTFDKLVKGEIKLSKTKRKPLLKFLWQHGDKFLRKRIQSFRDSLQRKPGYIPKAHKPTKPQRSARWWPGMYEGKPIVELFPQHNKVPHGTSPRASGAL